MAAWLDRWIDLLRAREGSPRVEVSQGGRSGHVTYVGGGRRASFYFEFGGGDCIAWISVPDIEAWQRETGLASGTRDDVLRFVAERVHRDHAGSARYTIDDAGITFWSR